MRLGEYKNKLNQDLQYITALYNAKLPDKEFTELIPPLSEEDRRILPIGIGNFYIWGRWFFSFLGDVVIPYNRILLGYWKRHILECFKSNIAHDKHDIKDPSVYDVYDLLKCISNEAAEGICLTLCKRTNDANTLMSLVLLDDLLGFTSYFSRLEISHESLVALTKTINILKQIEFVESLSEYDDLQNLSSYTYVLKSHISDLSHDNNDYNEIIDYAIRLIEAYTELVEDKGNIQIHEYINDSFTMESWYELAKRYFCLLVYSMRKIWESLSQEEKDIVNEVINPEQERVLIVNEKRLRPTNDIIQLALRWSKISRKNVLKRNQQLHDTIVCNVESIKRTSVSDYRRFFALQAPNIEYMPMRKIAARLAGKEKDGNSIVLSQFAYIQVSDIPRFCYFLLHKICPPDDITNVDFSKPIQWLGKWESLKYLVYRLYGKPKSLPSNIGKEITEAFRFKRLRQSKNSEGKIALKTFNNTTSYINNIDYEEIKRIDSIIKEFEPFMKRQN